jgi:hypothetical protein
LSTNSIGRQKKKILTQCTGGRRKYPLHLQGVIDPVHEAVRAGASELGLKLVFIDVATILICEVTNVGGRSDLAEPHDLVIADKKHTGFARLDEFTNLWKLAPFCTWRE